MRVGIVAKPSNNTVIIVVRILNRTLEYSQCYISEQIREERKKRRGGGGDGKKHGPVLFWEGP